MTLQDLRYVVALAEHGHFGRAAAACAIAQSTLSTQIKNLELALGVTLFERTTKAVSVTAAGAEVAGRARQVLAEVDAIAGIGQHTGGPLAGGFSLGLIPTLGPYVLPWLVPALRQDFPALRLVLREDLTAPLLERVSAHRLDAALVALPIPDDRLEVLALFDEPFWFAEPKGRHPATKAVMGEDELRAETLLLLTDGHCLRDQALAICGTAGREGDGDFRATSLETILQMVAAGLGSHAAARDGLRRGADPRRYHSQAGRWRGTADRAGMAPQPSPAARYPAAGPDAVRAFTGGCEAGLSVC